MNSVMNPFVGRTAGTGHLPRQWTLEQQQQATVAVLSRFIPRYRGFIAYSQNL